jgi:hypothetical protein
MHARVFSSALGIVAVLLFGCGQSPEPASSSMALPTTLADGVDALEKYHETIKTAFGSDSPGEAHDALHGVGHLLEHLRGLIESSDLPQAARESLESSRIEMNDAFLKIDESIHHGGDGDYDAVSEQLQNALDHIRNTLSEGNTASADSSANPDANSGGQ